MRQQSPIFSKRQMLVMDNEVTKTRLQAPPFPGPGEIKELYTNVGRPTLADRVGEFQQYNTWKLSPKQPWIKDMAYVEISGGRFSFDFWGQTVLGSTYVDSIIDNDSNEDGSSQYLFFPVFYEYVKELTDESGKVRLVFCNPEILHNVTVLLRVGAEPGYRNIWVDTSKRTKTPWGDYIDESGYYVKELIPYDDVQYKVTYNGNPDAIVQCTKSTQVIPIHFDEIHPFDYLVLHVDNAEIHSWSFFDAYIKVWD